MSDFIIEDAPAVQESNPYDAHVDALLQLDDPNKVITFTVPLGSQSEKSGAWLELEKHKRLFSRAANAVDRTAKTKREDVDTDKGIATLSYSLVARQLRTRKPKGESGAAGQGESATVEGEATA